MKASYFWLKEFLDLPETPEETADILRRQGFDVTSLTPAGGPVSGVVAARVEAVEKHPNADKLKLCRVFDGQDRHPVVCGAPNVEAGKIYPFARLGARLPGGLTIEKRALRGVESHGMLCSARELGLGGDASGLYVLPGDVLPGGDIAALLELGDVILEVEVTPNRPDALSHWGLARELAAAFGRQWRWPAADIPAEKPVADLARVEEPTLCSRYVARAFDGVKTAPAPLAARLRLERCGFRAINNLVDATNYALLELGHPLHVFDRDCLAEGGLIVRRGRAGETLDGLDGVTRGVENLLVIADAKGPVAAAGVLGGLRSGVTDATRRVILESACFLPSHIRHARGRWRLSTESSYRFERGADPEMAEIASRRAAHLIRAWAGGIGAGQADVRAPAEPARAVVFSLARVSALLGFPLGEDEARLALERLGFSCRVEGDVWRVTPPLHRADVRDTADVAEEVVRQIGYDRVPSRVRGAVPSAEPPSRARSLALSSRERFLEWGFWEASLSGLTPRALWKSLAGAEAEDPPELDNPLSLTGECLNPSLLVNLLSCLAGNVRRGNADARFFECARVFHREGATIKEEDHLAWVAAGRNHAVHWRWPARALEIWDAKAWAEEILKGWRLSSIEFRAGDVPFLHPAESQSIWMGERRLGAFGRLHPRRAEDWALPADTFLGEINLSAAARGGALPRVFSGLSRQPALLRDFSLVFPEHIAWARVLLWIHEQCEWVEGVELFDVFTGGDLPAGCRSLAFRVTFRHPDRTLTEAEAQGLQDRVLKGLSGAFQAAPRAAEPSK